MKRGILPTAPRRLLPEEISTLLITLLLIGLQVCLSDLRTTRWFLLLDIAIVALILIVHHTGSGNETGWRRVWRDWYVIMLLMVIFFESIHLIPRINPHDRDEWLIAADRWLFGGHDPTILLEAVSAPWLTEILQWVYISFYFLPIVLCLRLYLQKRDTTFHVVATTFVSGFYLSYIGYFIVPAIGPRFTLDRLQTMPLTGLLGFEFLRHTLGYLEGMMRDCFPSGHALISALAAVLCLRHDKKAAPLIVPWSLLLIFSSVYLRYHYAIDVIAGLLLVPPLYFFHRVLLLNGAGHYKSAISDDQLTGFS